MQYFYYETKTSQRISTLNGEHKLNNIEEIRKNITHGPKGSKTQEIDFNLKLPCNVAVTENPAQKNKGKSSHMQTNFNDLFDTVNIKSNKRKATDSQKSGTSKILKTQTWIGMTPTTNRIIMQQITAQIGPQYHTFTPKDRKTKAFVIRGLPKNIDTLDIKNELKEFDIQVNNCNEMREKLNWITKATGTNKHQPKANITVDIADESKFPRLRSDIPLKKIEADNPWVQAHKNEAKTNNNDT
ncbi:cell division protein penicillin-binding protein 2 [Lasius niger]|uniref:Cell division protein penicillin-binding protein 2 n=1 Tax=Lasius niger TaxID=67767 RepID=A0A0J7KF44_LASNI|nr:cell division protein penicillin-binding protein 2 [Lasius niger]